MNRSSRLRSPSARFDLAADAAPRWAQHALALAAALAISPLAWAQPAPVVSPAASAASAAAAPAAAASAAAPEDVQRVEVVGTRASLVKSLSLKRNAATVQDSISALELGRFPDDNVADSLSHITGVAISRTAGGEGQKVSVRGLGPEYTLTTFNGRILGTDGAGRDFAYDVLPSDVINGADVIKGAQAANLEGAIGGLINLRSASPFDQVGQQGILRLEGDHNFMSRYNGVKLSATYSNTFADDTIGVLFGAVVAKRKERTDNAGNDGGWSRNPDPNDESWLWGNTWEGAIDPNGDGKLNKKEYGLIGPGQFRYGAIMDDKRRLALSGKVEWRATENLRITADGIWTRLDAPQVGYQMAYYPLFRAGRWSNMTVANGIVTDLTLNGGPTGEPKMYLNPELLNRTEHRVVDTSLFGLNAEWSATPDLSVVGDLYQSKSKRHSGGQDTYVVLRMNQPNTTRIQLNGQQVPNVTTTFDDGRDLASGLAAGAFGAKDFNTHFFEVGGDNIDDDIAGLSVAGYWTPPETELIKQVQFGLNYTDRSKTRDLINNGFTGGSSYYTDEYAINVADLGGNVISHTFALPDFLTDVNSTFPRTFLAFDMPTYLAQLQAYDGKPRPGGGVYNYADAAPSWNPLQSYRVKEKTMSAYLQADMEGDRWTADLGVRLVRTKVSSQAWEAKIAKINIGTFDNTVEYDPPTSVFQEHTYDYILPMANFNWKITDKFQLRLGAAKTMARPAVDKLAPTSTTESVLWKEYNITYGGNAELRPYSAVQFDVSAEWYFAPKSIFNVAVFRKNITDQITNSWETGVTDVYPGIEFTRSRPINGDYARVHGIEFGLQHFWDNGFGVRAQHTRNWAKSYVGEQVRPLEGIAPSTSSLGIMYEAWPLSLSLNVDHTDAFVSAINVLGEGYNEEVAPITWVSASGSYEIFDGFSVNVELRNLLDTRETYTISGNPLLAQGYYRYGRAISVGASWRF